MLRLHPSKAMITSITPEQDWLKHLASLPSWSPTNQPILVVVPHPDDETLGVGGLIALQRLHRGKVTIVAVTDGENAYADMPSLREIREGEQVRALHCLDVDESSIVRLRLPDSNVAAHEASLEEQLSPMITEDTILLAPWTGDFHPDHEACGRAAEHLAQKKGLRLMFYFFWTWHQGTLQTIDGLPLVRLELPVALVEKKQQALLCHLSQLEREGGEAILPLDLRSPSGRPFEVFLPLHAASGPANDK